MIKKIITISLLALAFSCSDLDLAPISSLATGSMWNTTDDAKAGKYALYDRFRQAHTGTYQYYTEIRTDLYEWGKSFYERYRPHMENLLTPATEGSDWGNYYTLVNHCNLVLKYVSAMKFSEGELNVQKQILAEAYFMRALTYFWMIRIWGDVPVITIPFESDVQEDLYPERDPVSEVWQLIKSDLNQAETLYPPTMKQPPYLANLGAIKMLKADVYLWLYKIENESDALAKAEEGINSVLANTSYGLEPVFRNVFRNESNKENIFTIYRDQYETGPNWFSTTIWRDGDIPKQYHNNPVPIGGDNSYVFSNDIWNLLYEDPNDQRAKQTIDSFQIVNVKTVQWNAKYSGEYTDTRRWTQDIHVYRFAEALLFKAEIENAKNNPAIAVGYLNKVAERAYGTANYYSTSLSKSQVDEAILKERAKEFFLEGRYWWDLIRFDKVFDKVPNLAGRENELNVLLWPVAFNTINRNKNITQTPGYE
jgi:hypothetical protein